MESYYREFNKPELRFYKGRTGSFPAHLHNEIEMKCMMEGTQYAYCDGEKYLLKPGDVFIACPNQIHGFGTTGEECRAYVLIVKPSVLGETGRFLQENIPTKPVWNGILDDTILQMCGICHQEHSAHKDPTLVYSLLGCLLQMLFRKMTFDTQSAQEQGSVRRILQYCAEHYKENIRLEDLAEHVFLSKSHVSHIFSEKLKMSFPDYINTLRTAEAAKLLTQGGYTVSEVSELSGFGTIRSFNRAFRKQYGISPRAMGKI